MKIENFFTPEELALIDSGEYRPGRVELDAKLDFCIAAEREACAKLCEDSNTWDLYDPNGFAANLIRARGQA